MTKPMKKSDKMIVAFALLLFTLLLWLVNTAAKG